MATSLQTPIPLISSLVLLTVANAVRLPFLPKYPSKTMSFSYDFNGVKLTDLTYQGDGLVFFVTALNSTVNEPGGNFGVFDESGMNPSVFAVEFDSFVNEDFDPTYRHVGIDIQSHISSNVTGVDDAIVGQEVTACIKYNASTNLVSVHGSGGGNAFEVSYVYDLSTILPQQVQVGISAATGGYVAVHDVISSSFSSTMGRKKHN